MFNKKQSHNNSNSNSNSNSNNGKGGRASSSSSSKSETTTVVQGGPNMDIRSILNDIQKLGNSYMTWREKKQLENQKIVELGGKAQKKQKRSLAVAIPMMKNQKKREQKKLEQNLLLGQFEGNHSRGGANKRFTEKRRPGDMSLKCSEGIFRNGVLDVKHLLRPTPSRDSNVDTRMVGGFKGKKGKGPKGGGKKNKGKKKGGGGGKKRH
ncbi:hypothetical protein ACFE04_007744 [Oxalis oulophora]